jgi:hypothetical protein
VDSEEFEQIPWSALVTDQDKGVDRKVYLAVGVVGVVIALVFGARLFGGSNAQPTPPPQVAPQPAPAAPETTSTAGVVVSEADLMAGAPDPVPSEDDLRTIAIAEWFVTDYFTTDGSPETARSVRAMFSPLAGAPGLPHDADPPPPVTYVEWARASGSRLVGEDEAEVDVVFRTITDTGEGFERDPVRAVTVTMLSTPGSAGITGPPQEIPVPDLED